VTAPEGPDDLGVSPPLPGLLATLEDEEERLTLSLSEGPRSDESDFAIGGHALTTIESLKFFPLISKTQGAHGFDCRTIGILAVTKNRTTALCAGHSIHCRHEVGRRVVCKRVPILLGGAHAFLEVASVRIHVLPQGA